LKALLLLLTLFARAADPGAPTDPMVKDEDAGQPLSEPPDGAPPTQDVVDARTQVLADQLRCPVCQGLSVAASPSEAARAMRERIRELVAQGYGDEQIVDYFVDRYGTWILLAPPKQGFSWVLWGAPAAGVGLGLLWVLSRFGARQQAAPSTTPDRPRAREDDPYRAAILAELGDAPATKTETTPPEGTRS